MNDLADLMARFKFNQRAESHHSRILEKSFLYPEKERVVSLIGVTNYMNFVTPTKCLLLPLLFIGIKDWPNHLELIQCF